MIKGLRISTRLIFGFLVIALLVAWVSAVAYVQLNKLQDPLRRDIPQGLREIERTSYLDSLAQKIRYYDQVLIESARNYAYTADRKWKYRYRNTEPLLEESIKEAIEKGDEEDQQVFSEIHKAKLSFVAMENQSLAAVDEGDQFRARDILEASEYWQFKEEYKRGLETYIARRGKKYGESLVVTSSKVDTIVQDTHQWVRKSLHALVLISAFAILLAVVLGLVVSRSILRPLFALQRGTEKIGKGNLDHRIAIGNQDEIGQLAGAFNDMASKLKESYSGLEEKVRAKTRELANKVKEIEEQNRVLEETKRATLNVLEDLEVAKARIEQEKVEYEALLTSIGDGMIATDQGGKVMMTNQQAAVMLGCAPEAMEGRPVAEVFASQDEKGEVIPPEKRAVSVALRTGRKIMANAYYVRKDESRFPVAVTVSPISLGGKTVGAIEIFRDITKEKEIDRMKSEFITTVSHELRTPLTVIREGVSLVLDSLLGPISEEQKKFLTLSLDDIDRLKRIIDNLLDVSKIEAGKIELKREVLNMVALAEGVHSTFKTRAQGRGLALKTHFSHPKIEVYGDRDKLIQIFTNLIGNALKFTDAGSIKITVEDKGPFIECSVQDTGKGIAAEDLPKVFGKFQQFGRQEGGGEKGTGLGLSIAKGIVELHRGRIWVESELAQGTRFLFTLPKFTARELFKEYIATGLDEAVRSGNSVSLIVTAITNLDALHAKMDKDRADQLVVRLEQVIRKTLRRQGDMILRDTHSILMVLPATERAQACTVAKRIQQSFEEYLAKEQFSHEIAVDCRVAGFPEDGRTDEELLTRVYSG